MFNYYVSNKKFKYVVKLGMVVHHLILAFGRQSWMNLTEFKASLVDTASSSHSLVPQLEMFNAI